MQPPRRKRPALVTLAVALAAVPGGLAVFTSAFYLSRIILGSAPPIAGVSPESFRSMTLASLFLGIALTLGAGLIWDPKKPYYYPVAVASLLIACVGSLAAQLLLQTPVIAIGASWIATIASAFGLLVVFLSARPFLLALIRTRYGRARAESLASCATVGLVGWQSDANATRRTLALWVPFQPNLR